MASSRSMEIRFWWPMPLAAAIWLLIIWGFGLFLTSPRIEIVTPPSIEARFVELSESRLEQESLPSPRQIPRAQAKVQPKAIEKPPSDSPSDRNLEAPTDMMAYINQARARRRAAGTFDERENAETMAPGRQSSEEEIRMANIKRNLQAPGTNGIFRIVRMGARTAEFTFRGWTTDPGNSRLELIEVEAGPDGDVERAIVRRMIQLIRQYHEGNFNWESPRLGRVVVLSARMEENAGLEDFMMREFFGESVRPYMR
ncbi:MAG: hypothetical protein AABY81_07815 [Pseudomonadota bacterium]